MWNPFRTDPKPSLDDTLRRLDQLEANLTQLRLEWTDVLDKVLHRLQRQAKRDRDAVGQLTEGAGAPNGGGGTGVPLSPPATDPAAHKRELWQKARALHVRR